MDTSQELAQAKTKLQVSTEHFKEELKKLRTGRAHPAMLDNVKVEVYGQEMPLKGVATITAPEATLLQITPFDPNNLQAISDGIRANEALGLNPADDGRVVRIQIPPLTEESRQQMVKFLRTKVEDSMISARQIRHDAIHKAETAEKDKSIGRDDLERFKKQIDELLAKQKAEIEELAVAKEKEITTI
jgi:ribosome recycling factor